MTRIVNNRLCGKTHNVVYVRPDIDRLLCMAHELDGFGPVRTKLYLANLPDAEDWKVEMPTVTIRPFGPATMHLVATLFDGNTHRTIHTAACLRQESFYPLWRSMYYAGLKVGAKRRKEAEQAYFLLYQQQQQNESPTCPAPSV